MMDKTITTKTQTKKVNRFLWLLEKTSYWSSLVFERIGVIGVVMMILVTTIDVIGTKFFHKPLSAGTELVYFSQVVAIAGALAFTKIAGFHIRMEFIDALPKLIVKIAKILVSILSLGLFIIIAWKSFEYGYALMINNDVTAAARVPIYPFVYWMALSCIPLCLVLFNELVKSLVEVTKK